jgi:hypothetical protein
VHCMLLVFCSSHRPPVALQTSKPCLSPLPYVSYSLPQVVEELLVQGCLVMLVTSSSKVLYTRFYTTADVIDFWGSSMSTDIFHAGLCEKVPCAQKLYSALQV